MPATGYFNLSPQGDGKSLFLILFGSYKIFQLIPARGRKLPQCRVLCLVPVDFNLSPQGDGNTTDFFMVKLLSISTYPRKGTETTAMIYRATNPIISTYPRKGTETNCGNRTVVNSDDFNLSPQGDGNFTCCAWLPCKYMISTYPRKGTETV